MAQAAGTVSDTPLRAAPSSSRLSQAACSAFALAPYPAPHKCMVTAQPLLHSCAAGCLTMSNGDSSAYCQHTRRKQLLERTCRFPFKERYFVLGVGPMPFATIDTNPDVFQQLIRHSRHLPMYWPSLTKLASPEAVACGSIQLATYLNAPQSTRGESVLAARRQEQECEYQASTDRAHLKSRRN